MLKFGIAIAFPGTKMFADFSKAGLVRSYDWDDYFIYTEKPMFNHPNLSYETVDRYMTEAWNRAVLYNPTGSFASTAAHR